jgi:hypothetical protein
MLATMITGARAQEAHITVFGTDGLVPVPFEAANRSGGPIACGAALAHWYSEVLGRAAPGSMVKGTLWSDPKDGAVYLVNAATARMPIEALWCGRDGRDVSGGTRISLARRAGQAEPAIRLACLDAPAGERVDCRRTDGE